MGILIIETDTDMEVVWWAELAKKVGARCDYRFGNYGGVFVENLEKNGTGDEKPALEAVAKKGNSSNRFTRKIAEKCGQKKR